MSGVVRAIAYRPHDGDPMSQIDECHVVVGRGLDRENRPPGRRGLTLLSAEAWAVVCDQLAAELPWTARRANLLVSGVDLAALVGRPITIGPVRVWIHGESKPCGLMDRQHQGLRAALKADARGGVFGQVLKAGTIRVGDALTLAEAHEPPVMPP